MWAFHSGEWHVEGRNHCGWRLAVVVFAGLGWLAVKLLRLSVNEATAPRWLVSVVPIGSVLYGGDGPPDSTELELSGLVRMFVVVLAVEVAALAGNYL